MDISTIYLNVLDDQVIGVQTLVLGIALSVLEELEKELGGLDWPATLASAVDLSLQRRQMHIKVLLRDKVT